MTIIENRRDVTLRLARGAVIVEAAKRASGHLYVSTRDCRVAVTGTVFSVNSGTKGSRVSVLEGEVRVAQGSRRSVLHPGQQYSSSSILTPVALSEEIAWSRKAAAHVALLKELATLGEEMERQVSMPEPRRSSEILDRLPAGTVIYASLPNLGVTLTGAWRVFQQRLEQSGPLREWWERTTGGGSNPKMGEMIDEIQRFGAYFGEEVVITATITPEDKPGAPVMVSTLRQADFVEFARTELARMGLSVVESFESASAITQLEKQGILIYTSGGKVAISTDAVALRRVAGALEGTAPAFAGTGFHQRILTAYSGGATLLFAADVAALATDKKEMEMLGNFQYVIGSQRQDNGVTDSRGTVTFAGERTGMAAWLAEPAPIGALDYVSAAANIVSAFAVEDAVGMFDEMLTRVPDLKVNLDQAGAKLGFSFREDLAQAFGDEFVFAMDGPILPTPSWKLIAEVHNEEKLTWVLRKMVDAANQELAEHGKPGITLSEEEDGGRHYLRGVAPGAKTITEWHIVFTDGYMIAAPSRVMLDKAMQYHSAGNNLLASEKFMSMLPTDGYNNFSALMYHDLKPAVSAVAGILTEEQRQAMDGLETALEPTLILAYGAEDKITVASTSDALGFTPANLFGLRMPLTLGSIFAGKHKESPEPDTNPVI